MSLQRQRELTKDMQRIELDIFKEFKRICKENGFRYYAIGGTCLGAVRHKGFIPWDDDMDLVMPYEDYSKFCELAKQQLESPYELYDIKSTHWCGNYTKVIDASTTVVEKDCIEYADRYEGVYIDIMPLYGMSANRVVRLWERFYSGLMNVLNYRQKLPLNTQQSFVKKIVWIINWPIRMLCSNDFYVKILNHYFGKYSFDNSDRVLFGWRRYHYIWSKETYNRVFFRDDFKKAIELPFEDTTIAVPMGYERYLKMDFGDYMTLPPEEKQVTCHPMDILDLEKPYKEYRKERFGI